MKLVVIGFSIFTVVISMKFTSYTRYKLYRGVKHSSLNL